jgi:hypothetical protein
LGEPNGVSDTPDTPAFLSPLLVSILPSLVGFVPGMYFWTVRNGQCYKTWSRSPGPCLVPVNRVSNERDMSNEREREIRVQIGLKWIPDSGYLPIWALHYPPLTGQSLQTWQSATWHRQGGICRLSPAAGTLKSDQEPTAECFDVPRSQTHPFILIHNQFSKFVLYPKSISGICL